MNLYKNIAINLYINIDKSFVLKIESCVFFFLLLFLKMLLKPVIFGRVACR